MATYRNELRQGLPRVPGGEPWPPGGVAASPSASPDVADVVADVVAESVAEKEPTAVAAPVETPTPASAPVSVPSQAPVALRRGLPRVARGEPWPPGPAAVAPSETASTEAASIEAASTEAPLTETAAGAPAVAPAAASVSAAAFAASETPLRRGLPRTPGGEAWPAAGFAPQAATPSGAVSAQHVATSVPAAKATETAAPVAAAPVVEAPAVKPVAPQPAAKPKSAREPIMIGVKSLAQWVKIVVLGALGAILAAGIIVLAARGVTTLPGVPAWMQRYPGEYALPETAKPGFPAWARWGHFFNLFLMVLIIRSGILVRSQQQPPAFWTPKNGGKKVSINLWLHTSLDVLWIVNGVVFVVLLFVSGHWLRIVPTSWEVFPNAASAMLQYLTLDWPVEDGWVNYNSLQQIMYFLVIFVAAPVAIISGVRMSEWWPKNATTLNKLYPAPLARAVHFPTMLFFVLFILVHVFLVLSTGARKNLNHMFAGTPAVNWTGFWLFALALAITAAGWFACKPLILAPIANLFGRVSNR